MARTARYDSIRTSVGYPCYINARQCGRVKLHMQLVPAPLDAHGGFVALLALCSNVGGDDFVIGADAMVALGAAAAAIGVVHMSTRCSRPEAAFYDV